MVGQTMSLCTQASGPQQQSVPRQMFASWYEKFVRLPSKDLHREGAAKLLLLFIRVCHGRGERELPHVEEDLRSLVLESVRHIHNCTRTFGGMRVT